MSAVGQALIASFDREDIAALKARFSELEDDQGDGWLDTKQAAAYAGCSVNAVRAGMRRGLEYQQPGGLGGKAWFTKAALDRWRSQLR